MAEAGRDAVTPRRSQIGLLPVGVGERTEGQVDPGCAALVVILDALVDKPTLAESRRNRANPLTT